MELVIIFGPPAVGKMTVGHELCKLTGFKLLHNHMTVEPIKDIFEFGTPPFVRLVSEFRRRIIEEAADSGLPGLVLTFVWGLDLDSEAEAVRSQVDVVESRGGRARLVELYAARDERLRRNLTEFRKSQKRSLKDTDFSQRILLELDEKYVMNTSGASRTRAHEVLEEREHLRIDNTDLPAEDVAAMIASQFGY
jgi:hypothetical protein